MYKYLLLFVFGLLTGLYFNGCNSTVIEKERIVYDSVPVTIVSKGKDIRVIDSVPYPLPVNVPIDTHAIIQSYYTAYYHQQEIRDSNLHALISDSIFQNKILWRSFTYKITRPTMIVERVKEPPWKRSIYIGIDAGLTQGKAQLGPSIMYIDKTGRAYTIRSDVINSPSIGGSILFKIGK